MPEFTEDSFEILEDLSKMNNYTGSKRFNSFHIQTEDAEYSYKEGLEADPNEMLANEVAFNRYCNQHGLGLRAPRVISYKDDIAIFEWISAPLLVDEKYRGPLERSQILALVSVLMGFRKLNEIGGFTGRRPEVSADALDAHLAKWAENPLNAGLINEEEYAQIGKIVSLGSGEGWLQHGDLAFWHIFDDPDGPVVYDTEHASSLHDEFADYAHAYTSFYARNPDERSLDMLIDEFAAALHISSDELIRRSLPVLSAKAVARLNDSLNDVKEDDYREGARKLLEKVLEWDASN